MGSVLITILRKMQFIQRTSHSRQDHHRTWAVIHLQVTCHLAFLLPRQGLTATVPLPLYLDYQVQMDMLRALMHILRLSRNNWIVQRYRRGIEIGILQRSYHRRRIYHIIMAGAQDNAHDGLCADFLFIVYLEDEDLLLNSNQ
jgi:hypothetical protein